MPAMKQITLTIDDQDRLTVATSEPMPLDQLIGRLELAKMSVTQMATQPRPAVQAAPASALRILDANGKNP